MSLLADLETLKSEGILSCYAALISSEQPSAVVSKVLDFVSQICALGAYFFLSLLTHSDKKSVSILLEEGFFSSILSYLKGHHSHARATCLDLFRLFVGE